jgi:hypothetical protein
MPDISGLISAQLKSNEMERQSGSNLMDTITSSIREQGQRSFQQDAIEFFKDGNVSPQRLQEFSRKYPNVAPEETWKVASAVASQAKAQKMNNYGKSLVDYWKEKKAKGETINQDDISKIIPAEDVREFMPHMEQLYKMFSPEVMKLSENDRVLKKVNGKWEEEISPIKKEPISTTEGQAIASLMKKKNEKTGNTYTYDEAYLEIKKESKPENEGSSLDKAINSLTKTVNKKTGVPYTPSEAYIEVTKSRPDSSSWVELTAEDGKTAQKMQYNPDTGEFDRPLGKPYPVRSQVPNVSIGSLHREILQGVDGSGDPVWKDSRTGAAPFQWDEDGNKIPYTGKIFPRGKALELGGNEPAPGGGPSPKETEATNRAKTIGLTELTKRDNLQNTFIYKIEENVKTLERIRKAYGANYSRLVNVPFNKLQEVMGAGDYASLKLVLRSLSNEVAKIESGSLGIAEVSVEQAKEFGKIHDPNMTLGDIMQVANMSLELGHNANRSLTGQLERARASLTNRGSNDPPPPPSPATSETVTVPNKNAKGWVLKKDAQGNKAYVSPDGKQFEEVR